MSDKNQFQVSPQALLPDQPIKSNSPRVLFIVLGVLVILIIMLISLIDIIVNEKPIMRNVKSGPITVAVDKTWKTNPENNNDTYKQFHHVYDDTSMFFFSVSCRETDLTNTESDLIQSAENVLNVYAKYPTELIYSEFMTVNDITGYRFKYIIEWRSPPEYEYHDMFHTIIDGKSMLFSFSMPYQDLDDYELIIEEVLNSIKTVSGKPNPLIE